MDNLKELLEKYPINQSALAEAIGYDRVWLHQRLTGYRKWQPGELQKVEKYLNQMGKELSKVKLK